VPAHRHFGGAALIDGAGRLLGIGSLFVGDAAGLGVPAPGNMFVPIDLLAPIKEELVRDGRRAGPPRPWLGVNTEAEGATVKVVRVSPESPASAAGLRPGDVVLGVGAQDVQTPAALYRAIWALGPAGATVPLRIRRGSVTSTIEVRSIDRTEWLRSEKGL
jgi:S1-C subfamily serine protease